ncbi:MAG: 30S ribosomal protein S5 [Nanoarchaeota archaeon]
MAKKKPEMEETVKTEEKQPVAEEAVEIKQEEVIVEKTATEDENIISEKEIKEVEKEKRPVQKTNLDAWIPKTAIGKKVRAGEIKDADEILDAGKRILEYQIIDVLFPVMESDLLMIGQSKGKFGGGKRRAFRQTQKKTKEGNKPKFTTYAVIGNKDGYVGLGYGKAKETVPAREKAFRNAKLNVFKIRRGCGSWECDCKTPHSIPYAVHAKCGSVKVTLIPAPKGTGLCIEKECAKILQLAGIKDVWSKIIGQTNTKINTIKACEDALKNLMTTRLNADTREKIVFTEGKIQQEAPAFAAE